VNSGTPGTRTFVQPFAVLAAAIVGGATALAGQRSSGSSAATGRRLQQVITPAASVPASFAQGKALTINDIYRRSAPGVVQITSTSVFNRPAGSPVRKSVRAAAAGEQSLGSASSSTRPATS
jgi:hypothetical protein